ncbi:hypothetical protein K5V21_06965 [Clostridium sardiniense]|uniref:Uncharacterized protein n=1 Tax=Clostridium sardiniense TaxID=29369 RepID=A0ABS7KX91_CLOSR|nr:hypothetical protein [Clostridium sardiniense]MBY0755192.1 hypothetical protein [Clostridium sardiniense]MDQ0461140.1 hypothetical protein [Clostridium sardiniense]
MLRLEKKTFLKDAPEYEEYSDNVAKLTDDEKKSLGIKVCNCRCKSKAKVKK